LYIPAALGAIALSLFVWQLTRSLRLFAIVMGTLCVVFACGSSIRTELVMECGVVARTIVSELSILAGDAGSRSLSRDTEPRAAGSALRHLRAFGTGDDTAAR
jgi:hypothetical protein